MTPSILFKVMLGETLLPPPSLFPTVAPLLRLPSILRLDVLPFGPAYLIYNFNVNPWVLSHLYPTNPRHAAIPRAFACVCACGYVFVHHLVRYSRVLVCSVASSGNRIYAVRRKMWTDPEKAHGAVQSRRGVPRGGIMGGHWIFLWSPLAPRLRVCGDAAVTRDGRIALYRQYGANVLRQSCLDAAPLLRGQLVPLLRHKACAEAVAGSPPPLVIADLVRRPRPSVCPALVVLPMDATDSPPRRHDGVVLSGRIRLSALFLEGVQRRRRAEAWGGSGGERWRRLVAANDGRGVLRQRQRRTAVEASDRKGVRQIIYIYCIHRDIIDLKYFITC